MKRITTKDKLTAFVQACVDVLLKETESVLSIRIRDDLSCKILLEIKDKTKRRWSDKADYRAYSLADLIMDADAMRSAYGTWGESYKKEDGSFGIMPIATVFAMQATRIAHDKGTEAAINYLYDNLGGEEK